MKLASQLESEVGAISRNGERQKNIWTVLDKMCEDLIFKTDGFWKCKYGKSQTTVELKLENILQNFFPLKRKKILFCSKLAKRKLHFTALVRDT